MNDAIRARRELTMTVICKSCEYQYGAWRPRCPACGTATPVKESFNSPRVRRAAARRVKAATQCVFCHHRGAKTQCPVCNEKIHSSCLSLHQSECEQFQREVAIEASKLEGAAQ